MILTQSDKIELERFCRKHSPLTEFVRSLQMNLAVAKTDTDPSLKGKEGDDLPSLLEGIDLDTLPVEVQEALKKKEESFKSIQTEQKKLTEQKVEAEKKSAHFQSLADKRHELIRRHNLPEDGKAIPNQTPQELLEAEFAKDFEAQGMKPEVAKAYAKMHASTATKLAERVTASISEKVMPMAGAVSNMQAASVIESATSEENDPHGILQIPEIRTEVEKQIGHLASQGVSIDISFVQKIANMEYGALVQKNPEIVQERSQMNQQQQPTRISSGGGGGRGNFRAPATPRNQSSSIPTARDIDTQRAWDSTAAILLKGIKPK